MGQKAPPRGTEDLVNARSHQLIHIELDTHSDELPKGLAMLKYMTTRLYIVYIYMYVMYCIEILLYESPSKYMS